MSYRIGSFNVRKLNYSTRDEDSDDQRPSRRAYETIGRIIMDNFDIAALQEVLNMGVLARMFPPNSGWEYRWERSRSKSDNSDEGYAYAWNTRRIALVDEPRIWVQYRQDSFLGGRGLLRHPYYGRFTPVETQVGGPFCEIRLINTHLRDKPKLSSEKPGVNKAELRRKELMILIEQVLNKLSDKRYGDYKPAYTFLLGDYNLNLRTAWNEYSPYMDEYVIIVDANRRKKLITVQDKKTTLHTHTAVDPRTGEKKIYYGGYANNFDHFTYDEYYFDEQGISVRTDTVDTVTRYMNGDFERHWKEISDHIPIILEFSFRNRGDWLT